MILSIQEIKNKITPILSEYNVEYASLFGSYARGEATEDSDVDIFVHPGPNSKLKSILNASGMRLDMIEALGKSVDLITHISNDPLDRYFRENFYRDEVVIYGTK